jgi:hypothetical protein
LNFHLLTRRESQVSEQGDMGQPYVVASEGTEIAQVSILDLVSTFFFPRSAPGNWICRK